MARDSKEIRELKIKALWEAIEMLKEESTISKSLLTPDRVVALANENYSDKFTRNISPNNLKKAIEKTKPPFTQMKKNIDSFNNEHKKLKNMAPKKSKSEIVNLKNQVENLMSEVAKFYDDKVLLNEKLEQKARTIVKISKERDDYYQKLSEIKG